MIHCEAHHPPTVVVRISTNLIGDALSVRRLDQPKSAKNAVYKVYGRMLEAGVFKHFVQA